MMESADDKVHLRIRFAGLCLFAPDRAKNLVHVLFPHTGGHSHSGHDGHDGNATDDHQILMHWLSGGERRHQRLDGKRLVLQGPQWGTPDYSIKGVFDIKAIKPSAGCPSGSEGKADPAKAAAWMELHTGASKVINKGAKWRISKTDPTKHYMPTVLDWWVKNVGRGDVAAMLQTWGLTTVPDTDSKNTMNLWVLHVPAGEQDPGTISSEPGTNFTDQHFTMFYSLLVCEDQYDTVPDEYEVDDVLSDDEQPDWPRTKAIAGMLVTCMVAKADIA